MIDYFIRIISVGRSVGRSDKSALLGGVEAGLRLPELVADGVDLLSLALFLSALALEHAQFVLNGLVGFVDLLRLLEPLHLRSFLRV